MANEWFFKWHFIGRDGPVEIDSFDGRKIRYGGIGFEGTPRHAYWDTLRRYLSIKVGEVFDQLEIDVRDYPVSQARSAVDDAEALVSSFCRRIAHDAVDKDRILRGDGIHFPERDEFSGQRLIPDDTISARAHAVRALIDARTPPDLADTRLRRTERFLRDYKEIVALLLVIGGAVGAAIWSLARKVLGW